MTQPISQSVPQFDFPLTQSISPLLLITEQLNSVETDLLARANRLPKGEVQDSRKAEIRAFLSEMRSDIDKMIDRGLDFAYIAFTINEKIVTFDLSFQYHRSYNAEYERLKREVQVGNRALGASTRQMNVDLAPITPKKRSVARAPKQTPQIEDLSQKQPEHQTIREVYQRIINDEQQWLKRADCLLKEQKAPYLQAVRVHVKELGGLVKGGLWLKLDSDRIDFHIEIANESFKSDLERKFPVKRVNESFADAPEEKFHPHTLIDQVKAQEEAERTKVLNDQLRERMESMFLIP